MREAIFGCILCACGGGEATSSSSRANLSITFGAEPPVMVDAPAYADATADRILVRAEDVDALALFSIERPAPTGVVTVNQQTQTLLIWAKRNPSSDASPVIADIGHVTLTEDGRHLTIAVDVSTTSGALRMVGSINGVLLP